MNNFPFFRFPYNNYYRYYNYRNNLNRNINRLNYAVENSSTIACPSSIDNNNIENYVEKNNNCMDSSSNIVNNACQKTNYKNDISQNINYKDNANFKNNTCKNNNCKNDNSKLTKNKSSKFYLGPLVFDSSSFSDLEKPVLEILGLKLYLDDILILSLLYFLYEEDVKDETLFISLLLLLIS